MSTRDTARRLADVQARLDFAEKVAAALKSGNTERYLLAAGVDAITAEQIARVSQVFGWRDHRRSLRGQVLALRTELAKSEARP